MRVHFISFHDQRKLCWFLLHLYYENLLIYEQFSLWMFKPFKWLWTIQSNLVQPVYVHCILNCYRNNRNSSQNTHTDSCYSSYDLWKIVHHFCEYTKRCKTSVLMFVRCTEFILIAFDRVVMVCMSTILRGFDTTTKTHATNAKHRATYARARAKLKHSDRKVL